MKKFLWLCIFLLNSSILFAQVTSLPTALRESQTASSDLTYEKFTADLKTFNAEIYNLQQQQLPFIYKRYCVTNSVPITPDTSNSVLCGTIYRNADFVMQDTNEGTWSVDDLNKGIDYEHFIEKGNSYNFTRAQVFSKSDGYASLADIYFAAPDFKVLNWKVPEVFNGEPSWFFQYRNNNVLRAYHISQITGFILSEEDLRYEMIPKSDLNSQYRKLYYKSYFVVQSKVDLPDSFFLDKINSTFQSYESQAILSLFYQLFLPLFWSVFFAWLFMRLIMKHRHTSNRMNTGIFIFAIMEPFFLGSLFFLLSNGAYMEWMIFLGASVRHFFESAMMSSSMQIRSAIASFNAIFVVDAMHIILCLMIAYPFVRIFVKRRSKRH